MLYFIKDMHVREFGFPRLKESTDGTSQQKRYKWKKTNFVTDLPKHKPLARYLVAKTCNESLKFSMHVSVDYREYNDRYKNPAVLKMLKSKNSKLLDEDKYPPPEHERIMCCHVLEKNDHSSFDDKDFE